MTQIRDPLPAGPTTNARIETFERQIGYPLPSDYRRFLLRHNGGRPDPDAFLLDAGYGDEENIVLCFFPLRDLNLGSVAAEGLEALRTWPIHCAWDDLQRNLANHDRMEQENPLLPIGTDGSGNYFCIVLAGHNAEGVVFLDHETAEMTTLGDNFDAFLASLRPRERTDYAMDTDTSPPESDIYARFVSLVRAGACVQCGGSGKCFCIRKGPGTPAGCVRCNGSGDCNRCGGMGIK